MNTMHRKLWEETKINEKREKQSKHNNKGKQIYEEKKRKCSLMEQNSTIMKQGKPEKEKEKKHKHN